MKLKLVCKVLLLSVVAVTILSFLRSNFMYDNALLATPQLLVATLNRISNATSSKKGSFLVDTPVCKIPFIEPFDSSIVKLLKPGKRILCNRHADLTYTNGTHVLVNPSAIGDKLSYCAYQPITRPKYVKNHNYFKYGNLSEEFNESIRVSEDFVKVRCYNYESKHIYTNFHHFIHSDISRDWVKQRLFQKHAASLGGKKLSVLMLGVDSVSRLNFMRYMQKTRSYLLQNLSAIEFVGYNKVADNTFVNVVPMTMGQFLEDIPWNETLHNIPFDSYNFIWKQYSDKGYTTLYAEDKPKIAIFDFLKAGFHQAPGDYFNRHYTLAMEEEISMWYNNGKCFGNKLETDVILDYVKDFIFKSQNRPFFSFAFITGLTHDFLENTAPADPSYLHFFQELSMKGSLKNTLVVFFSDHGMRFGSFRNTYSGRLEERLPFLFILAPPWFEQYPGIIKNLRKNAQQLTTPFDIYETLVDVLNFSPKQILKREFSLNKRGFSLFSTMPINRTCEDASILPHWCTCTNRELVSTSSTIIKRISIFLLQSINKILTPFNNLCAKLKIDVVQSAEKLGLSDTVLKFVQSKNDVINRQVKYGEKSKAYVDYTVIVRTIPGGAIFEATIQHNEMQDSFELKGDISRINAYAGQSHCITVHSLKKLCFCKK